MYDIFLNLKYIKKDREVLDIFSAIDKVDVTTEAFEKGVVKLCVKTSGMCFEYFHGFLRIMSLTDRKLCDILLPFQSIVKFLSFRELPKHALSVNSVTRSLDGGGVRAHSHTPANAILRTHVWYVAHRKH